MDTSKDRPPIAQVRNGMHVVDRAGEDIGVVKLVRKGDPQPVAGDGEGAGEGKPDLIAGLGEQAEPELIGPFADRMLRAGYLKIDCSGFFPGDAYTLGDEVVVVHGTTVHLSSTRDSSVKES
ncbi:hypothetical protein [Actinoplanes sp. NPDC026623]|uniref:hypothetical protein n=1 Tax=Actinoplanes sp. NPDC026623 TaxID=3155610 RepID=UPI0034075DB1